MNFQTILNFITNPIGIVILFGLFSTVGRLLNNAKEQRAKKQELSQIRNAQRDSLRTGSHQRTADTQSNPSVQRIGGVTQQSSQTAVQDASATKWDKSQELRKQRIQELRAKRDAQMKKIQQRSANQQSATSQAGSQAGTQAGSQPSAQPTQSTQQSRQTLRSRAQAGQQSASRSGSRPVPQMRSQPARQQASQQRSLQEQLVLAEELDQSRRVSTATNDTVAAPVITPGKIAIGSPQLGAEVSSAQSTRTMLRQNIKQAIIAKEVLGPPLGLRTQESGSMHRL